MNRGLCRQFFQDAFPLLLGLTAATMLTELLLMAVMGEFSQQDQMTLLRQPFIQRFLKTLLGAELTADLSATGLISLGFTHPIIYALSWSFILSVGTRVPAGEIERGTADLLLTLPVSRSVLFVSVSLVVATGAAVLSLGALAGLWIADRLLPLWEPLDFVRLSVLAANLFALQLCVCGAALCASSQASRRGTAIELVLGWLLTSFLLAFLGQFSETARAFGAFGVLHYHRPLLIVQRGDWPVRDLAVLIGAGGMLWTAGFLLFRHRDIPAA